MTRRALRIGYWLLIGLLGASCNGVKPCKTGTLFLTLNFDAAAATATRLHVVVAIAGGAMPAADVQRATTGAGGTVEVAFDPGAYPQGKTVVVTVTALSNDAPVGAGTSAATVLGGGCGALTIAVTAAGADGGTGDAAVDRSGADGPHPDAPAGDAAGGDGAGSDGASLKPNGERCSVNAECQLNHCVDGYCCDGECTGACEACDVSPTLGICTAVTSGQPHNKPRCNNVGTTCGGACSVDSRGACKYPLGNTLCRAQICQSSVTTFGASCDGAGNCPGATTMACASGCNAAGTDCVGACQNDGGCNGNRPYCNSGTCLTTKPNGRACQAAGECTSASCVDGYCCDSGCTAQCQACNVAGNEGKCTTLISGQPHNKAACPGSGACAGSCQGQTACSFPTAPCTSARCSGATFYYPANCNGAGACGTPPATGCNGYSCNPTGDACLLFCSGSADCTAAGAVCDPNRRCCVPDCTGRTCGSDGCGGLCGPGCATGTTCGPDGNCCQPKCGGVKCDTDDGCGGLCGCATGQACFKGLCCQTRCGQPNSCGKPIVCGDDGCGGTCGACAGTCCDGLCSPTGICALCM
jgi:hypothetical protein